MPTTITSFSRSSIRSGVWPKYLNWWTPCCTSRLPPSSPERFCTSMEGPMQASGNTAPMPKPVSRLRELGLVLPKSPTPLGAYVEASGTGSLLFLSGMLPVANGKLAITGRLGENLSVEQGHEAARLASLNALAAAQEYLGDLERLKKLLKLT